MATKAKEIFDAILAMKPGESMIIPSVSKKHRESVRVGLYKERAKWQESCQSDNDVLLEQITYTDKAKNTVYATKAELVQAPTMPFIISKDGDISVVKLGGIDCMPEAEEAPLSEEQRMRELMKQEGKSQEEIDDFFDERKEEG